MLCQCEACKKLAICLANQVATDINLRWQTAHGSNGTDAKFSSIWALKQNMAVRSIVITDE